jgi:hypothetical protein
VVSLWETEQEMHATDEASYRFRTFQEMPQLAITTRADLVLLPPCKVGERESSEVPPYLVSNSIPPTRAATRL